jgi:hypothetical protein
VDELLQSVSEEIEGESSDAFRSRVKGELQPGERLLWTSRSLPRGTSPGLGTIITSVVTVGLFFHALASLCMTVRDPLGQFGPFIGTGIVSAISCVALSLWLLAGWHYRHSERRRASETLYALTDRRAIIWRPSNLKGGVESHAIPRGTFVNVHRIEYADGHGEVIFSYSRVCDDEVGGWRPIGFEGVAEVRRVEEMVRRTLLSHGDDAPG